MRVGTRTATFNDAQGSELQCWGSIDGRWRHQARRESVRRHHVGGWPAPSRLGLVDLKLGLLHMTS